MIAQRLQQGERVKGTMLRVTRNPIMANIAKNSGLDFIMLDMEHGAYSFELFSDFAMAARSIDLGIFVRVPELARGYVSRVLDMGANGVMAPMIESAEQACLLVEWSKYAPVGNRGMTAYGGHTDYQKETDIPGMMENQNKKTLAIAQIESEKGIKNIEDIAGVEGLDVLLVGPNDLSVSLGCPENMDSPIQQDAISKVAEACQKHNKIFGIHGGISLLEKWIPDGLKFLMSAQDFDLIFSGMKNLKQQLDKIDS